MKLLTAILPFAAISNAFVLPDEIVMEQIAIEEKSVSFLSKLKGSVDEVWSGVEDTVKDAVSYGENAFDIAMHAATDIKTKAETSFECHRSMTAFDTQGWLNSAVDTVQDFDIDDVLDYQRPHKPHKPHKPKRPHHGPHHKPNQTIYQLIASSKYTSKLAKIINEYPDLVEILNGTDSNYTVFAPVNEAFEKLPHFDKKPSREIVEKILTYHVSTEFYPAGRILFSHTIPTAYREEALGGDLQRLRISKGITGLRLNSFSKIIAPNIFATNGVIHGLDTLLLPPPSIATILEILPGEFSTLSLGLTKTGLDKVIQEAPRTGGTFFAPSNFAFKRLGPRLNAFLFSKYGEKYLAALLKYHVVANQTLYSDAFYGIKSSVVDTESADIQGFPNGRIHLDLPTLLDDKSLSIDVGQWGAWISIRINGFNTVAVQDGIAKDGVLHVLGQVLIPPKSVGGAEYDGEEMTVEEFKDRMGTYIQEL